ncbi:hypothetical protein BDV97DRAFT_212825 [Delphinella strobiligena]|nr:hypothetical protein BDV97DRAFT_212825 [Delphinella strobiligena]
MVSFLTPNKSVPTPDPSFSHHEAFALSLVEDTPSPARAPHVSNPSPLTDVYQDHVLRSAHSFAARSTRSFAASDTLRPPSIDPRAHGASILGELDPNDQKLRSSSGHFRSSPTPSLKKRKAEQILKDHGSPPGLRVTAGGRIVPSDQSPLCSPRFGYSAIQKNGGLIRFAPNYPPPPVGIAGGQETSRSLPNGFVAQDPSGRLLQVVDGQFLPVNEISGIPQLYIAAPNLNNFPPGKMGSNPIRQQAVQGCGTSSTTMRQPTLTSAIQIQALEKQYSKLEQESRDLDKLEVLQRPSMTSKAYQQLIQSRRELVTRLNDIRVSLKALKDQQKITPEQTSPEEHGSPHQHHLPPFTGLPVFAHGHIPQAAISGWSFDGIAPEAPGVMQFPGGPMAVQPELGYYAVHPGAYPGHMPPYTSLAAPPASFPPLFNMMGMPPAEAFHGFANAVNAAPQLFQHQAAFGSTTLNASSPNAASQGPRRAANDVGPPEKESPRRSHALEIRNPETKSESGQGTKSSLNPMSPSYQPASVGTKPTTPQPKSARTQTGSPSPALAEAVRAHNAWVGESRAATSSGNSKRGFRYESSNASFATADFFPNNPRDHSANKQAYPVLGNRSMNSVKCKVEGHFSTPDETPSTPEKECHNPNWNPTIPDAVFDTMITPPVEQEVLTAPPGTPARADASSQSDPVRNRSQHNMSPKSRRPDFLAIPVGELGKTGPGSVQCMVDRPTQERSDSSSSSRLPTSNSGSAYMEGFRAGEARLPIGQKMTGVWLDGYCAGLRAFMKTCSGEASPAPQLFQAQSPQTRAEESISQQDQSKESSKRPYLELNVASFDTLKEAIFSSQNENVILSPDHDSPAVSEIAPPNLDGWSKQHGIAPSSTESVLTQLRNGEASFPERTSSMVQRQLAGQATTSDDTKAAKSSPVVEPRRNFSVQSQPNTASPSSYLRAAYPANRVLSSQLEWKSGSSIAQVAALGDMVPLTSMSGNVGTIVTDSHTPPKRSSIAASPQHPRFIEGSMRTDEAASSSPSPGKKSPTKTKFAQIAGKAGIKVRVEEQPDEERTSPKEKPRWRDVWRKGH